MGSPITLSGFNSIDFNVVLNAVMQQESQPLKALQQRQPYARAPDGAAVAVSHARTPEDVDWAALGVDLVMECSGAYARREDFERFLAAGCPRLMVSHPANSAADVDRTIVYGVNQDSLAGSERLVSCASCTTNAVVPVLALLDQAFGVEIGRAHV